MRTIIATVTAVLLAIPFAPAWSQTPGIIGAATVVCSNGAHVVTVAGYCYDGASSEFDHILLQQQAIGVCETDVFLEDDPLPFLPVHDGQLYGFTATVTVVPPRGDVVYRYIPYLVRPDGTRLTLSFYCDADSRSYGLSDCDTAPFLRGRVEEGPGVLDPYSFRVVACEGDCWTEPHFEQISLAAFSALAGESAFNLVGQVVDVYGRRTYCGLLGDPGHVLTRIARTAGGLCGPVPVEAVGWGAVKAMYR